jgi:two-component system cell cycle sensor histidine kinase/response regulator CckA
MEGMWRFFAEGVPDILLQLNDEGTILYINRVPGVLTPSDVLGTSIYDHLPPAAHQRIRLALEDLFEHGEMRTIDLPITLQDGRVHWYSATAGPMLFGERVVAVTVLAREITVQKTAELALRESEAKYRTLVEHAPEAIVVLDVDAQRFVEANGNACLLFGLTREQLFQRGPAQVSPTLQPDGRCSVVAAAECVAAALRGEAPAFEWTHLNSAGDHVPCEVRLVRLPASNRRLVRGSIIDITGQRGLERQIQQFQKLDALGHVAAGIAHDFNNILHVIGGSTELLLAALPEGSDERAEAIEIRSAATRGSQITKQILAFASKRTPAREDIDLNLAVDNVAAMLGRLLGPDIVIAKELREGCAHFVGDRGQVDQILVNLLLNARDAMPKGGTITITTRAASNEDACVLRVSDTGTGMDPETMARIFQPFFTTKPAGRGTGLGLSTVSMIVQQFGGRVEVSSEPGVGSAFDVILPARSTTPSDGR